jgi:hypothetical protein
MTVKQQNRTDQAGQIGKPPVRLQRADAGPCIENRGEAKQRIHARFDRIPDMHNRNAEQEGCDQTGLTVEHLGAKSIEQIDRGCPEQHRWHAQRCFGITENQDRCMKYEIVQRRVVVPRSGHEHVPERTRSLLPGIGLVIPKMRGIEIRKPKHQPQEHDQRNNDQDSIDLRESLHSKFSTAQRQLSAVCTSIGAICRKNDGSGTPELGIGGLGAISAPVCDVQSHTVGVSNLEPIARTGHAGDDDIVLA